MRLAAASATPAARAWCSRSRAAAQWRSSASLRRPREGNRRFRPRSPRQPSAVAPSAAEHLSGRGARRPPLSSSAGTVTAACVRTTGAACLSLRPARMPQGAPRAPAAFSQLRAALQVRPFTSSSAGAPAAVPQLPTVPGCTAVYVSTCTDPWTNLAVEEWLFRKAEPSSYVLFLYRNRSCVVIGRNQNPWKECDLSKMRADNVPLVRRRSGGGTVYHDGGNTNYSIHVPRDAFVRRANAELVVRALHQLEVPAEVSDRHDIVIERNKVSGSAFKLSNGRAYHHGTMLINSDLEALGKYLRVYKPNIVTKGVESVRSTVTRLCNYSTTIDHRSFCDAVAEEFTVTYEGTSSKPQTIEFTVVDDVPEVKLYRDEIMDWNWTFGQTPEFANTMQRRFADSGLQVSLLLQSKHGMITDAKVSTNADDLRDMSGLSSAGVAAAIEVFSACLVGCNYSLEGIDAGFRRVLKSVTPPCAGVSGKEEQFLELAEELRSWIKSEL